MLFGTQEDKGLTQTRKEKKQKRFLLDTKYFLWAGLNPVSPSQQAGLSLPPQGGLGWGWHEDVDSDWSETWGSGLRADGWDTLTVFPLDGSWDLPQTLSPTGPWEAGTQAARQRRQARPAPALHWSCRRLQSSRRLRSPAQLRVLRRKVFSSSLKSSWFMGR